MRIDQSELCVVALCDICQYRTIRPTPAAAWTALALHAKSIHDDPHAARRAQQAAYAAKIRGLEKRRHPSP